MTDAPIGQQVSQWLARLTTISRNLMELAEAESTKSIRARLHDAERGYTGVTKAQAAAAVASIDELLAQYAQLAHVVDEAARLVGKGGVLRNHDDRARDLLNGPSVIVRTQQVAARERGLLDDAHREVRTTPAEVLATMEHAFSATRDTLATIVDAGAQVRPRLAALAQAIAAQQQWATRLGTAPPALPDLSAAARQVERDPLSGAAAIDDIEATVARWRLELQAIESEHAALRAALARDRAALADLRAVLAKARVAFAEASATLVHPVVPPATDDAAASLDAWLQTLEQHAADGRFAAVKVGLAKWEQQCNQALTEARTSYARNADALNERTELRGRFQALSAKAEALRGRGAVLSETVTTSGSAARGILDALPFDSEAARRAVASYEAAIAATPH